MLSIDQFIEKLPKAETHLHLEGAVPWGLVLKQADEDLPTSPAWLNADYRFADFSDFSAIFDLFNKYVLMSPQGYHDTAKAYFQKIRDENVRYVEVSIGVDGALMRGLPITEIVEGIYSAVPSGLIVQVIGGISRCAEGDILTTTSQAILETPGIVGVDLHGDERINGPETFRELFEAARTKGYLLRAHAGELTGADTIRRTIDSLGVTRIEHGISAREDESLIEQLIENNITFDMCPTSNVKLEAVEDWNGHPLATFLRRGVRVTCSTDDPGIFATSPNNELRQLVRYHQLTVQELATLQINAFEVAICDDATRRSLIAEVQSLLAEMENSTH